jgi:hypothetical protein
MDAGLTLNGANAVAFRERGDDHRLTMELLKSKARRALGMSLRT